MVLAITARCISAHCPLAAIGDQVHGLVVLGEWVGDVLLNEYEPATLPALLPCVHSNKASHMDTHHARSAAVARQAMPHSQVGSLCLAPQCRTVVGR